MGKKARMKRERATQPAPVIPVHRAIQQANMAQEDARIMSIYSQLQEAIAHARLVELNDKPFSDPDNAYKIEKTFGPMLNWLNEQLVTGESDAMPDGTIIFRPHDTEEWFPVGDSFRAVADTFTLICESRQIEDQSGPMRQLANRIDHMMPLTERDVVSAIECLEWMKSVIVEMTPTLFSHYSIAYQTRNILFEQGLAGEHA